MEDIKCPYCEKEVEICHDDGFGYREDVNYEMECPHCGKNFVFTTTIIFNSEAHKADCLNDGKHDYKLTHTFPRAFSKMRCSICERERGLTEDERIKYKIETKESYCNSLNKSE